MPPAAARVAWAALAAPGAAQAWPALAALLAPGGDASPGVDRLWLYLTIGASPIVTEELAPILGGVAVAQGRLALGPVILALTLGGWLATALLYGLGRWRGRWVRRRFPRVGTAMKKWLRGVRRRPWRSAMAVRFALGARLLLPLACGAAHVRADVYLIGSLLSSIVWSAAFAVLGLLFGEAALAALHSVRRYDQYAVGVLAGLGVLVWLILRSRRRAARALTAVGEADGPDPDDAEPADAIDAGAAGAAGAADDTGAGRAGGLHPSRHE